MALNDRQGYDKGSDSEDLEALECEVEEMAEKILEYRATLPGQLKNAFATILAAQKPLFPGGSDPGTCGASNLGKFASDKGPLPAGGDQDSEKIRLLRDKVSCNVAAVPIVLERMKEFISKIDKLDPQNRNIPSA